MTKSERGVVIIHGDVPADSLAFQGASIIAESLDTTVVVTNVNLLKNTKSEHKPQIVKKQSITEQKGFKQ